MKIGFKPIILSICLVGMSSALIFSQSATNYKYNPLTLSEYLCGVTKGNLGYIASQFDVSIAEAEFKASRVLPDPEISMSYSNNEDRRLMMGQAVETGLSYPINFGNKRKAGIALTESEYILSQKLLDAYFENLRADAALSYFASLKQNKIHQMRLDIYNQLQQLAKADSIRLLEGEATSLDALQSSLEARSQQTEVFQSYADMQNSYINLMLLQGKEISDTMDIPSDSFPVMKREFNLGHLVENAITNRSDLMVAMKNKEVSKKYVDLLKANRAFEFSLETVYSYNSIVKNEIAPAPAFNGLSAGISFPLKFSNLNKGPVRAANLALQQSQISYNDTELQIMSEVIQAYTDFIAQSKKIEHYDQGLVNDAGKILQGRIYSYQHGESGLIEVLNAQRKYIDLQLNHLEALFDYTRALIELERSAGIWDITR
jgi:cobalt-zinc-cadmium efflux system outer membrane protein